jgi:hypothetical protein
MLLLSPRNFTACNQADVQNYYNKSDNPLLCRCCPKPNKTSTLSDYLLSDGKTHWYMCPVCMFAGTGTEYLARVNQIEIGQQIQELVRKKIIPPVDTDIIQKFRAFRAARQQVKRDYSATAPFRRETTNTFAGMYDLDMYEPAKLFRQDSKQTFEQLFRPSLAGKRFSTSSSRLFHGKWAKITAIPLYDLPLHLSGLLFVNGHEQGEQKLAIKRLSPSTGKHYFFDPGFLGTKLVLQQNQSTVILCSKWQLTLSIQAAVYRQENKYPPLLGQG